MYYDESLDVHLQSYSEHHIDVVVLGLAESPWRLTCVYGEPRVENRHGYAILKPLLMNLG